MSLHKSCINSWFITPMLLAYEPPKHVKDSPQMEDALKALITDAALAAIPRDWSLERATVYAKRLWDECLLGQHYGLTWPKIDVVRKAGVKVAQDMTEFDKPVKTPVKAIEDKWEPDTTVPDFDALEARAATIPQEGLRNLTLKLLATGRQRYGGSNVDRGSDKRDDEDVGGWGARF